MAGACNHCCHIRRLSLVWRCHERSGHQSIDSQRLHSSHWEHCWQSSAFACPWGPQVCFKTLFLLGLLGSRKCFVWIYLPLYCVNPWHDIRSGLVSSYRFQDCGNQAQEQNWQNPSYVQNSIALKFIRGQTFSVTV